MQRRFTKRPSNYVKASEARLAPGMEEFVTDTGKATMNMFKKYGLLGYYDPMSGSASIPTADFESVKNNIMRLLKENEGWVLGYGQQASGYEEDFWYVTDWLE